ncbi:MAG: Ni/Fe hydrogenase subunit alpha [Chloroflexota bacterium]
MSTIDINVHHLTRVEGHGNILVKASNGKVEEARWEVAESPRFFEVMLRGRPWTEAHVLASRICGICSVSHQIASIRATEAAFGITPSEQTWLLRKLLYDGEVIESHVLHFYFLAAPDFLGAGSVFPLAKSNGDVVARALRLKKLGNDTMEVVGGRTVHPQAAQVNGFGRLPTRQQLLHLREKYEQALGDLEATVQIFSTFTLPDFARETEFIALKDPGEFALISGDISSTDIGVTAVADYLRVTNEYCVPQSTAKFTRNARGSYAVGALARINNNYDQLRPLAKRACDRLGLKPVCHNPFMNNVAQLVETVHVVEEGIEMIDRLLGRRFREEEQKVAVRKGRGVGAVEAPRGLLIHDYTYDDAGYIVAANCIIPTNQNHGNIQHDLEALVPRYIDRGEDEVRLLCEMLVRSYDPCISCSTH